jgi:phosphoglycerate dehydrogenase-like enzyme
VSERLNVIYLSEPHIDSKYIVEAVLTLGHGITIYDPSSPLGPQFVDADVVIDSGGSVGTPEMLDAAVKVRLWQIQGSGIDHFPFAYWARRGVRVANCPGAASAPALAERAMMFTLMLMQRYSEAGANVRRGIMYEPRAQELNGRVLGMIGFGAAARAFARLAAAFGMRIAAVDIRDITDAEAGENQLCWRATPDRLDELIQMSDVLSLHLHLTPETHHILDERRLGLLRPGAYIINVSRGELIDEVALLRELQRGRVAGAGLDVVSEEPFEPDNPLLSLPTVVATPHTAGNTDGTLARRAAFCADNVDRVAHGLDPNCLVSGPVPK